MLSTRKSLAALAFAALAAFGSGLRPAHATSMSFTASGSGSDGALAATILFTPLNGQLEVTITNTLTGSVGQGQAVSALSFTLATGVGPVTAFTELKGRSDPVGGGGTWTATSGTAFDATTSSSNPSLADTHWGFANSSGDIVATAGTAAPGGNPTYMILPSAGTWGAGGGGSNFNPFIIGPGNFFFTAPNMTTSTVLTSTNITNVNVGFGTSPDTTLTESGGGVTPGSPPPPPVPLPAAAWSGMALLAGLGVVRKIRKAH